MKTWTWLLFAALAGSAAAAELYRWVDEKGRVQYTDTPPPPGAKSVEQRRLTPSVVSTGGGPLSVQEAAKNFPVTLWTTPTCGEPCDNARAHLAKRGVPHAERNAQTVAERDEFKKVSEGELQVPVLVVGTLKPVRGYLADAWDTALDSAGYPRSAPPLKPAAK